MTNCIHFYAVVNANKNTPSPDTICTKKYKFKKNEKKFHTGLRVVGSCPYHFPFNWLIGYNMKQ